MILGIYGSGGLGKGVRNLAGHFPDRWQDVVFIDDVTDQEEVYGLRVYRYDDFRQTFAPAEAEIAIALGEPAHKATLFDKVHADGYRCATIVHPDNDLSPDCQLGEGCLVFSGCYVSAETVIEDNVCLMPHVGIGHNVRIGRGSQVSMGCNIGGHSVIGSSVYLGLSATVRDRTTVGDRSIISQGACVLQNVPEDVTAMGNPARAIARNTNHRVWD